MSDRGVGDEVLVAYLDGRVGAEEKAALEARIAADPALQLRVASLRAGMPPVAEAYAALLAAAPVERLQERLAADLAVPTRRSSGYTGWGLARGVVRPAAVAAGVALFLLGAGTDAVAPRLWERLTMPAAPENRPGAWRDAVADYVGLTTSQTLTIMRPPTDQLLGDLRKALGKLDLAVDPNELRLPGRTLMRVELYHYDNEPLVQIAYLDEENGPISLCITRRGNDVEGPEIERRHGMNIAYWSTPTHAFMLIGRAPKEILGKLADVVAPKMQGKG